MKSESIIKYLECVVTDAEKSLYAENIYQSSIKNLIEMLKVETAKEENIKCTVFSVTYIDKTLTDDELIELTK